VNRWELKGRFWGKKNRFLGSWPKRAISKNKRGKKREIVGRRKQKRGKLQAKAPEGGGGSPNGEEPDAYEKKRIPRGREHLYKEGESLTPTERALPGGKKPSFLFCNTIALVSVHNVAEGKEKNTVFLRREAKLRKKSAKRRLTGA